MTLEERVARALAVNVLQLEDDTGWDAIEDQEHYRKRARDLIQRAGLTELALTERERDAWKDTAAQHCRNEDFYRGLVQGIGLQFGEAARTADDGTVGDSVLALKVPELVADLRDELKTHYDFVEQIYVRHLLQYAATLSAEEPSPDGSGIDHEHVMKLLVERATGASAQHHDEHHEKEKRWLEKYETLLRERDTALADIVRFRADHEAYKTITAEVGKQQRDEARAEGYEKGLEAALNAAGSLTITDGFAKARDAGNPYTPYEARRVIMGAIRDLDPKTEKPT